MERLAHYTILEKIGEGGMGQVYRARDDRLKREVAIKVLPEAFVLDPERLARFEREAQVLASLQHPNVAAIFGLEEDQGQRFLALEFVPGEDLSHVLGRGTLPVDDAIQIALQIATAVEAAHEVGIVHRDLKPSNVMLTPEHEVKVLDFGLAKAVEGDLSDSSLDLSRSPTLTGLMTDASVILGTAAYMAPEQARGKRVDKRADVWAFGVILFEMLTGARLFDGETVSDTLASVLKTDPDFDTLPADTPHHVRALLHRCLTRDPRLRLRDMGEARIILDAGEDIGLPAKEGEGSGIRLPLLAGVAAISLLVGAALGFLLKPAPAPEEARSPRMIRLDSGPGEAVGYDPIISPDGKLVAFIRDGSIWVRDLATLETRHLERTEDVMDVFWSPTGDRIGYLTTGQVMTVDPVSGVTVTVAAAGAAISEGSGAGGVWSPEHGILFARGRDHVFRVSDRGGEPTPFASPDTSREGDLHEPSLLPDGGLLVVPHAPGDEGLSVLEAWYGDERHEVVHAPEVRIYRPVWSPTNHVLYEVISGNAGIWAVPWDLAGRQPRGEPFLVAAQGTYPDVADDGTLIFLRGSISANQQMVEADREGNILRRIGEPRRYEFGLALSPDATRLAVIHEDENESQIWIRDLVRGTESRLTFHPSPKSWPVWSRDGRSLLYGIGTSAADRQAVIQAADGRSEFDTLAAHSVGGDMAPDGGSMLAARSLEGSLTSWDIHIGSGRPGGEWSPLVVEDDWQYAPRISPDGAYFTYVSRETGEAQVFLKRFPDGSGKWQVSIDGGSWPQWNAAGDRIVYTQGDRIMEVDVETSDPPVLGSPRLLFERPPIGYRIRFEFQPDFGMSGDGERFYFYVAADSGEIQPSLVLYQDWEQAFTDD